MDHGGIHACLIHLLQQVVLREGGDLTVVGVGRFVVRPDVDLRVDDQHGVLPWKGPDGRLMIGRDVDHAGPGGPPPGVPRAVAYRYLVGHMMVRHMWADGLSSKPRPSSGCLKCRPTTSVNSSSSTCTSGSKA